jgi:hypothetical protein
LLNDGKPGFHLRAQHLAALMIDRIDRRADLQVGGGAEGHHQAGDEQK